LVFHRGLAAAGGAGDESPLIFDDTSLKVETTTNFSQVLIGGPGRFERGGAGGRAAAPAARELPRPLKSISRLFTNVIPARA